MLELERGRDKPQYARFITWLLDDRERFAALDADGTKTVDVPELAEAVRAYLDVCRDDEGINAVLGDPRDKMDR